jgi:rubrerythrin
MIGAIRTWDVLRHPIVTIRCFGWKTYLRALMAGPKQTFLSLLNDYSFFGSADSQAADIVKQCIDLELRANRLYLALAEATADSRPLAEFFAELAEQEQEHADLLQLCLAASNHVGWRHKDLPIWRNSIARLSQEMCEIEAIAPAIHDPEVAMRLVIELESSEVNQVFLGLIAASNSEFVKKLRPFQYAVEMHLSHIAARVSELAPHLRSRLPTGEPPLSPATPPDRTVACADGDVAGESDYDHGELVLSDSSER